MELNLEKVKLVEFTRNMPYLRKEEVKELFGFKESSYINFKKEFIQAVKDKEYPTVSHLKVGNFEIFAMYPMLHFAKYFEDRKHKFLKQRIPVYNREFNRKFEEIGA